MLLARQCWQPTRSSVKAQSSRACLYLSTNPQLVTLRWASSSSSSSRPPKAAPSPTPSLRSSSPPSSSPPHHHPHPHEEPSSAQPPPTNGPPRLIRHPPSPPPRDGHHHSTFPYYPHPYYPAPHYYVPPSPLGASILIAKQRAARRHRTSRRFDSVPLFQFRSSLAEVDFDSPTAGWSAQQDRLASWSQTQLKEQYKQVQQAHTIAQQQEPQIHQPQQQQQVSSSTNTMSAPATELRQRPTKAKDAHHTHEHTHAHSHTHTHSLLGGHDHSHSHGSPEEADRLLAALKGRGDRGSNITLLGLFSNIVLCISKGIAGVFLNSASLLADAAHSLSDMFSDLVTLFCWKMSQKPPSQTHPLGYGKYETMGGLGVSVVLVGGAVGIGMHSWGLLLEAMGPMLETAPAFVQTIGHWTGSMADTFGHSHGAHGGHEHAHAVGGAAAAALDAGHASAGALDPNAMWFALLSVAVKEWLYRATMKVAKDENSSVLEANALHHRSDSLSSGVTFLAIGGSWMGLPILDPLGGLLVAGLIGKQGYDLLISALAELSDRGVDVDVLQTFEEAMRTVKGEEKRLRAWRDLRAIKSGVSTFVDITLLLDGGVTLREATEVEDQVRRGLVEAHKGVKEVRVHFAQDDA